MPNYYIELNTLRVKYVSLASVGIQYVKTM